MQQTKLFTITNCYKWILVIAETGMKLQTAPWACYVTNAFLCLFNILEKKKNPLQMYTINVAPLLLL